MKKERKRLEDAFTTLYTLMEGDIPFDYLESFALKYENGCESWLDILPLVEFKEEDLAKVVEFFSYVNPKFFPPKGEVNRIEFSEISGGKGRLCTKGIYIKDISL